MKSLFLLLAACAVSGAAEAKTVSVHYRLSAPYGGGSTWAVVRDIPANVQGATVYMPKTTYEGEYVYSPAEIVEVPSQLDDLDGDGRFDELVFAVGLNCDEPVEAWVEYSTEPIVHNYKPLVNAHMGSKNPDNRAQVHVVGQCADVVEESRQDAYGEVAACLGQGRHVP